MEKVRITHDKDNNLLVFAKGENKGFMIPEGSAHSFIKALNLIDFGGISVSTCFYQSMWVHADKESVIIRRYRGVEDEELLRFPRESLSNMTKVLEKLVPKGLYT